MNFILPFLLIFAILFAVLERTKALGEKLHNLMRLFFCDWNYVNVLFIPKEIVSNMVCF
jgi:hypothetical protein